MRIKSLLIALTLSLVALTVSDIRKAPDPIVFNDYRALDMAVSLPKTERPETAPEITSDFIEREVQDLSEYDCY